MVWVVRHSAVGDAFFDLDAAEFLLEELQPASSAAPKQQVCWAPYSRLITSSGREPQPQRCLLKTMMEYTQPLSKEFNAAG